jgi:hypothetical protein
MISWRGSTFRAAVIEAVALAGLFGTPSSVLAQALKDVQIPDTPLVLKAQGSFVPSALQGRDLDAPPSVSEGPPAARGAAAHAVSGAGSE